MHEEIYYEKKRDLVRKSIFLFLILSITFNSIDFIFFQNIHMYDFVHGLPILFIYEPTVNAFLGGELRNEFILLPLVLLIDMGMGALIGVMIGGIIKHKIKSTVLVLLLFMLYWHYITVQWLIII